MTYSPMNELLQLVLVMSAVQFIKIDYDLICCEYEYNDNSK